MWESSGDGRMDIGLLVYCVAKELKYYKSSYTREDPLSVIFERDLPVIL